MIKALLMVLLFLTALFLILLVLVQRGKGGGLAGALGGMGGQSAFGTKAGDMFTKITIGVAAFWILLCVVTVKYLGLTSDLISSGIGANAPVKEGFGAPITKEGAPASETPGNQTGGENQAPAAPASGTSSTPAAPATPPAGSTAPATPAGSGK